MADPVDDTVARIERVIVPEPVVVLEGRTVIVGVAVPLIVTD